MKKNKGCEQGGKICIFNLGDCPFEGYLSASHYSSTTWHFSLSPRGLRHKKQKQKNLCSPLTLLLLLLIYGASRHKEANFHSLFRPWKKKKANWQAGVLSTSLPIGGHSSWLTGDIRRQSGVTQACCPRAGALEWSVAAEGASISGSQRDAAKRCSAPAAPPSSERWHPSVVERLKPAENKLLFYSFLPPFLPTGETGVSQVVSQPLAREKIVMQ